MLNLRYTSAYAKVAEHNIFGDFRPIINDKELENSDPNEFTKVINKRKEKYKNEVWFDLLRSNGFTKYLMSLMLYALNYQKPEDKYFYVHSPKCATVLAIIPRDVRGLTKKLRDLGLIKFIKKGWAGKYDIKIREDGIFLGYKNFYSITDELLKFIEAYEDVFKIEIDMSSVGLTNLSCNCKNVDSLRAFKKFLRKDLKTYHGGKVLKEKSVVTKDEEDLFDLPEVQEVFEENRKHDEGNENYFIESGKLRITSDLCNTKKSNREDYLRKLHKSDKNGNLLCYEFDRTSSIYNLEYDLNHDVKEASNFDFYQFLEFSLLQKLKDDNTQVDIVDFDKFCDIKFSYGALRHAFKVLPMPLFMRGNCSAYIATKLTIIEEKIQQVLNNNEYDYIRSGAIKVQNELNIRNQKKDTKYIIRDHDYDLYTAASQILDSYGLAHSRHNFKFLLFSVHGFIKQHLGHDKRKKHIFFFESLVMSFTKYYLHLQGVKRVDLLYDALYVESYVPRALVIECMNKAIIRVKEITKKYLDDNYKNKKKKPDEFVMQNLKEDELVLEYKEFIKDKTIIKNEEIKFDEYVYDNYFKLHNSEVANIEESRESIMRNLGYNVA